MGQAKIIRHSKSWSTLYDQFLIKPGVIRVLVTIDIWLDKKHDLPL